MSKSTALDRVRKYLERSHATSLNTIPVILASGENRPLKKATRRIPVVFTAAGKNGFYRPESERRNALIKYRIPKDWHRLHVAENPTWGDEMVEKLPDDPRGYSINEEDRRMYDVMYGGRATTYDAAIPNEFIDEICFGPNGEYCYDPKVLREHIINKAPDNTWEWDYRGSFHPDYPEVFEKYGRK